MNAFITSMGIFFVSAALVVPLTAVEGQSPAPVPAAGDPQRGEGFYLKYGCWQCHGYTASTGTPATTPLVSSVLNQNGFINFLRNPRGMPVYTQKTLPDSEAADIYAYVRTFPRPPEANDIPLLQQIIDELN